MKTRHSTLSRHSKTRYAAAKRDPEQEHATVPAAAARNRRHDIHHTNLAIGPHAGRSIGKAQDGTSDDGGAPGTGAAIDPWIASVSGGRRLACSGHARALHAPRCGRLASTCAIRRNGGVPVAHDIAARRAFYPGRDRPPRNRASRECGVEGGIGNRVIHAARRRRRYARDWHRARPPRRPARSRAAHAAESRSGNVRPLAILRSIKTPASSRSDRRPDARRRR